MTVFSKLKKLIKHNNRGSGFLTVLVAVTFLASFGSMLLMISYTGNEMRITERKGKENLYNASAVMDEIRAGLQYACSEAVIDAYDYVLLNRNEDDETIRKDFREHYRDSIASHLVNDTVELFSSKTQYNSEALLAFCGANEGDITIESVPVGYIATGLTDSLDGVNTPEPIVLKGVSVECTYDGLVTRVTADLSIGYPSFEQVFGGYTTDDVSSFACIVRGRLIQDAGVAGSSIYGNAYFGDINLSQSNVLTFDEDGEVVTPADIHIGSLGANSNPRLICKGNLWANSINLDVNSSEILIDDSGTAYIANDLVLNKSNSKATIKGSYYGFGSDASTSGTSSSIIVNYTGTKANRPTLDIEHAGEISLAGYTFIETPGSKVRMSESASVKKVQRAYKVPAKHIDAKDNDGNPVVFSLNPQVMTPDDFALISNENSRFVGYPWGTDKSYDYYNAKPAFRFDPEYYGQGMAYVYIEFSDDAGYPDEPGSRSADECANQYFLDYYRNNSKLINDWVEDSIDVHSSGNDIYMQGETALPLTNGGEYLSPNAYDYSGNYETLKTTLGRPQQSTHYDDPVEFLLNEANTQTLAPGQIIEYKTNDDVTALLVNGDITINSEDYPDVNLVVQISETGTVYLERDFSGLIMSNGDLRLADGVELNKEPEKVIIAYQATDSEDGNILYYTENIEIGKSDVWSVNDLVSYSNWRKNSED